MGENLTNIERFPNNIFVPDRVNIKGNEYIRYRAYFRGLDDVQKYLMSNPTVNEKAFPKRASKSLNIFSYGLPYFWVVRNLNKEPRGTYKKFLELSDTLDTFPIRPFFVITGILFFIPEDFPLSIVIVLNQ